MNKLTVQVLVALLFVAVGSSSAQAQIRFIDPNPYFGRILPRNESNVMAIRNTVPQSGLAWALSQRGRRVGSGQCTDLVVQHVARSGGRPGDFRNFRAYIWGGIPSNGWRAGDIIQFEQCKFRYVTPNSWREVYMDHHTAIIVSVSGSVLQILHQNAPFGGPVVLETLDLSKKTQGTYVVWRPVAY